MNSKFPNTFPWGLLLNEFQIPYLNFPLLPATASSLKFYCLIPKILLPHPQNFPATEYFIHVGLPIWSFLEFHIGYHAIGMNELDRLKKMPAAISNAYTNVQKKNFTGGMTTFGLQFAF